MAIQILFRTLTIYLLILVLIRLMGKREVGQLSAFDLVVAIMIAELAVLPMENLEIPLLVGLIPLFTLVGAEIFFSYLFLKKHFIRRLIDGSPSVIIFKGRIREKEMRRLRYTLTDLLSQLREKSIFDLHAVEYAFLENTGELSVVLKPEFRPLTPVDLGVRGESKDIAVPLILDGKVDRASLRLFDLDEQWLFAQLQERGYRLADIFFAALDSKRRLFIQEKERR